MLIVMGLAAFLWDENRDDHRAEAQRADIARIGMDAAGAARDAKATLNALEAALARSPATQRAAIETLFKGFEERLERQTNTIIRETETQRVVVIHVTSSPSPQPTATVTCDPTPVIGSCRR